VLRDLHGFPYKEIAQITGSPVSTVNSRLHDARETLRRKLGRFL
jgi:DNA-directed RNA polymerase specialized sigma24 family protein